MFSISKLVVFPRILFHCSLVLLFISFNGVHSIAQSDYGMLTGRVLDGATKIGLPGATISRDSTKKGAETLEGGIYFLKLIDDKHTIYIQYPGYQTKIIRLVDINRSKVTTLNIMLFPESATAAGKKSSRKSFQDSVFTGNSDSSVPFARETSNSIYNPLSLSNTIVDRLNENGIQPGTDKNTASVLNRLNHVILLPGGQNPNNQSFLVNGMGERYNQLMLNRVVMNSTSTINRSYPLELLPAEALESVTIHRASNASLPADFAGGSVEIKTKDMPSHDFFMIQIGAGFSRNSANKEFFGDRRNSYQISSFPGSIRNLPAGFPTAKSQTSYSQKNIQEQIDLSRLLKNNLGPVNYGKVAVPDDRIMIGFGKVYRFKKGLTMGITGYVNHVKQELIEETTVQVSPDVINNPFPFDSSSVKLINSQSKDINYNYSAQLGGVLNASFYWRANKISIRNYLGNQFFSRLSIRDSISKPDESVTASDALRYTTEQRKFWYAQIAGEHTFGENSKFQVDWQATYNYANQQNPDERNFLLNRNTAQPDLYEIAQPLSPVFDPSVAATFAPNFTNSSRLWRKFKENVFTGSINIRLPFNLLNHTQILNGGLYMQDLTRDFLSDLLLVSGGGFTTMDNLLSPERYYPGGLAVTNYFSNIRRGSVIDPVTQTKRGNYFGSRNVAASYLYLENRFLQNIYLQWGLRLESNNQSSTIVQYEYAPGYRFPQRFSTEANTRQITFNLLPSVNLMYLPVKSLQLNAGYARTVNRPLLQELTGYNYYDAGSFLVQSGNTFLGDALINNFSATFKYIASEGTHVSLAGFYKEIDQPIEEVVSAYSTGNMASTPFNMPPAIVKGLQADLRFGLNRLTAARWFSNISVFASGTLVKSKVEAGPLRNNSITRIQSHTLSGTPEYSFNAGIVLQDPGLPEISVMYNTVGDYITKVGSGSVVVLANGNSITTVPDYRVTSTSQLNIQLAQKFFKSKIQLIAGVSNLLDNPVVVYQDLNGNKKFDSQLSVSSGVTDPGLYRSGTDNTISNIKSQQNYYFRLSYHF